MLTTMQPFSGDMTEDDQQHVVELTDFAIS
jgi:hypothetical protein